MAGEVPPERRLFGETWVYESIVGAIPGLGLTDTQAVLVQFGVFEAGVLVLSAAYGLWNAVVPGTVAVLVAALGSAFMLDLGSRVRRLDVPERYRRLLFASRIEVVLGLFAYVGLVTYLFVYDPRRGSEPLLRSLLGPEPPLLPTYLLLLVLWDLCYRIGTGWWAAVVALWRSSRYAFDDETAAALRAIDLRNAAFGLLQLALVPFVAAEPLLVAAVVGHVIAVVTVSGLSVARLRRGAISS